MATTTIQLMEDENGNESRKESCKEAIEEMGKARDQVPTIVGEGLSAGGSMEEKS